MARIGIVCEGSHDFLFLREIADELLKKVGLNDNTFDPLQPRVDATSRQIDGGGYEAVHQWLRTHSGIGLRSYFEGSLFASSTLYDYILVQVDGDVSDLSIDFKASDFTDVFQSVPDRVQAISSWLLSTAKAEPIHSRKLIPVVPTLQTEAWITGALRPNSINIEDRSRKKAVKRFLRNAYTGSSAEKVSKAGIFARAQIALMINRCLSFKAFDDQIAARCR